MVGSWYLTHATKNASRIFMLPFFVFVLQRKMQGSCMSKHENKRYAVCRTKSMLNAYAWWCNDSCKMWCWNMIRDKCRNDMFIMMPWRDACAMHDTNASYRHESLEDHLFLLTNIQASWFICSHHNSAPCMHLRRWRGPSDFPWHNDEINAMHAWWRNIDIHAWEHVVDCTE